MERNLKGVKPQDLDISNGLMGSPFGRAELEIVATNVILISRWHNGWFAFSWGEYCHLCKHPVTVSELDVLEQLVSWGVLERDGEKFRPTDRLIETLEDYIK